MIDRQMMRFASADFNLVRTSSFHVLTLEMTVQGRVALSSRPATYLTFGKLSLNPGADFEMRLQSHPSKNETQIVMRFKASSDRMRESLLAQMIDVIDRSDELDIALHGRNLHILNAVIEVRSSACEK